MQGIEIRGAGKLNNRFTAYNPSPECVAWRWFCTAVEKCAGAPSCMNHTFWYVVVGIPRSNCGRSGKFAYVQVSSTLPRRSKSLQLFGNSPRLAHPPPYGYYYRDFRRLIVVCDLVFYNNWSPSCCLQSAL
ncbi:hypothetical protein TNCV_1532151 [Trichonephila clavipes]|nr:hypothetical protein TNCV_1532151 [Trichonephila clavipes]